MIALALFVLAVLAGPAAAGIEATTPMPRSFPPGPGVFVEVPTRLPPFIAIEHDPVNLKPDGSINHRRYHRTKQVPDDWCCRGRY